MNAEQVLSTLKDVEHVLGSFAGDQEGQLIASSMPSYFSAGDLEAASGRIAGLFLCAKEADLDGQTALLNFGEHSLFVSRFERGHLCILSEAGINLASLRMAARLVARRLPASIAVERGPESGGRTGALGPSSSEKPAVAEPFHEETLVSGGIKTEPPPLPSEPSEAGGRRTIVYRGRRFEV